MLPFTKAQFHGSAYRRVLCLDRHSSLTGQLHNFYTGCVSEECLVMWTTHKQIFHANLFLKTIFEFLFFSLLSGSKVHVGKNRFTKLQHKNFKLYTSCHHKDSCTYKTNYIYLQSARIWNKTTSAKVYPIFILHL